MALVATACTPPTTGGGGTTTTAEDGRPVAVASASPTIGDAPLAVSFDSSGSSPGTGVGLTYSWDFGDGTPAGSGPSPTHVYESVGVYTAKLTMSSSAGSSTSPGITVTVNLDPNPKFYVRTDGSTGPDCGPLADPCASIVEAQTNAVASGVQRIRVAGGNYSEPLSLVSNMDITGGWAQDFSDFSPTDVTTIFGTGTTPAVTVNGVNNAKISGVSAQGVTRTSGDAVGMLITGGASGVVIGSLDSPLTLVGGGSGPHATGVLVTGGSLASLVNVKVNSGTTVGAGRSAYGVRALGLSVLNISLSEITAQPGVAGTSSSAGTPGQAASGCGGNNGGNASGPSSPGGGGGGGGCATH
ncbi:MAG: PKD domain-containing protein, partial [Microthrixaceae bacterium]